MTMTEIEREKKDRIAKFVAREIFCTFNEIVNLTSDDKDIMAQLDDIMSDPYDYEAAAFADGWNEDDDGMTAEEYCEKNGIDADLRETMQYFVVSQYAYERLGDVDAHVGPFADLFIWCRKECGQALEYDADINSAIEKIIGRARTTLERRPA